jgi:hypothetical protein
MRQPEGETFVLWVQRARGGNLTGSVEHIADSSRRDFDSVEELGHLIAQALADAPPKETKSRN